MMRLDASHGGAFVDKISKPVTEHGAKRVGEFAADHRLPGDLL